MIYLDNAATTRPFSEAVETVRRTSAEDFYNPSSLYPPARALKAKIERARETVAAAMGVRAEEIFFTSGATEADNWAVFCGRKNKNGNIVSTGGEHSAVYECLTAQKNGGAKVALAPLNAYGGVSADKFLELAGDSAAFVSVIHGSNETGAVNDVFALAAAVKKRNGKTVFHSDGVQTFCKFPLALGGSGIDLYSVSAHKIGGPKGVGALYCDSKLKLRPYIYGGGQEGGARSGTENAAAILGFAEAVKIYTDRYDAKKILEISECFIDKISALDNVKINSVPKDGVPGIVSLSLAGVNAEVLQRLLAADGIFIGLGSACASSLRRNRVLAAAGLSPDEIAGSVRASFGIDNTLADAETAAKKIIEKTELLRSGKIG